MFYQDQTLFTLYVLILAMMIRYHIMGYLFVKLPFEKLNMHRWLTALLFEWWMSLRNSKFFVAENVSLLGKLQPPTLGFMMNTNIDVDFDQTMCLPDQNMFREKEEPFHKGLVSSKSKFCTDTVYSYLNRVPILHQWPGSWVDVTWTKVRPKCN